MNPFFTFTMEIYVVFWQNYINYQIQLVEVLAINTQTDSVEKRIKADEMEMNSTYLFKLSQMRIDETPGLVVYTKTPFFGSMNTNSKGFYSYDLTTEKVSHEPVVKVEGYPQYFHWFGE